jgi:succinate-acetate transporter protein
MVEEELATITIDGQKLLQHTPANPAPLGLLATGLTLVLLSFSYAGFYASSSMILAMALAFGGTVNLIVGAMEYKNGNTFATLAFGAFGSFWYSFALLLILPKLNLASAPDAASLAAYLFMWGVWTAGMIVATLKTSRGLQIIFAGITLLFFVLGLGALTGNSTINIIGGYVGIFVGLMAMYVGVAEVINEVYGNRALPT